jgi:Spy/CpxP family protein refolding chaperone
MDGSKRRALLLLGLTFVAGTAAGVAAERLDLLAGRATADEATQPPERGETRRDRQTTIERFADQLGLTSPQRTHIEEILDHYRTSVRGLWGEWRPRYRSLMDSVRTQIEAVLTPEQVTQYRALLQERRDRNGRDNGRDDRDSSRGGKQNGNDDRSRGESGANDGQ